jgi:mRNA interferase MazF
MPRQGDIVLIPVPFTDLSSSKRRPVIVISNDTYNQSTADMIVVAMTSVPTPGSFSFLISSSDLRQGQLNRPGTVRVDKIYTLDQSLIVKQFGQVNSHILSRIQTILLNLTAQPLIQK